ncbi:MAG: glycosyltransferase family 39 protein [Aggregatilineales bacterium]
MRKLWFYLIPFLLIISFTIIPQLNQNTIWSDEWFSYFFTGKTDIKATNMGDTCDPFLAEHTIATTICLVTIIDSWPPVFYLLLQGWDIFSGANYYLDRAIIMQVGLIAICLMYRLGHHLFDEQTGLIASILMGSCVFLLFYMTEIRGYTFYVMTCVLSAWIYLLILKKPQRLSYRIWRWAFPISIAMSLYSHYVAAASVLALAVYHLLRLRKIDEVERKHWSRVLRLWVNGCLLFTPWLAALIVSFINESLNPRSVDTLTLLNGMIYGFSNNLWLISIPGIVLPLFFWRNRSIQFLYVWGFTILAVAITGNIFIDFLFHPRHMMGLLPAFCLLIAFSITRLSKFHAALPVFITGLWAGAGLIHAMNPAFMNAIPRHISSIPLASMQTIVDTVAECATPDDNFIFSVDTFEDEWVHDFPLEYYSGEFISREQMTHLGMLVTDENNAYTRLMPEELFEKNYTERVQEKVGDSDRIWVFALPELPNQTALLQLDDILQADDYARCDLTLGDDVVSSIYMRGNANQCAAVQSCAGQ